MGTNLLTVWSAPALKPEESSWKQQSRTGPGCTNSPLSTLASASYSRTVCKTRNHQISRIKELGFSERRGRGAAGEREREGPRLTLSHEDTRRLLLWLEKRRLEIPSEGGLASSLPLPIAAGAAAALMMAGGRGGGGGIELGLGRRRRRDSKFERATGEASTRGRSMGSGRFKKSLGNSGFEF